MRCNMAVWDRVLRVAAGIILLTLGWAGIVTGGLGLAFKVLGFVPLTTGLIGYCPAYALFGGGTRRA
jgi:hypothetical protein